MLGVGVLGVGVLGAGGGGVEIGGVGIGDDVGAGDPGPSVTEKVSKKTVVGVEERERYVVNAGDPDPTSRLELASAKVVCQAGSA